VSWRWILAVGAALGLGLVLRRYCQDPVGLVLAAVAVVTVVILWRRR
jgi:4-amino-4-deoxy-L-arabinose transferase-like glycosyltransferase